MFPHVPEKRIAMNPELSCNRIQPTASNARKLNPGTILMQTYLALPSAKLPIKRRASSVEIGTTVDMPFGKLAAIPEITLARAPEAVQYPLSNLIPTRHKEMNHRASSNYERPTVPSTPVTSTRPCASNTERSRSGMENTFPNPGAVAIG